MDYYPIGMSLRQRHLFYRSTGRFFDRRGEEMGDYDHILFLYPRGFFPYAWNIDNGLSFDKLDGGPDGESRSMGSGWIVCQSKSDLDHYTHNFMRWMPDSWMWRRMKTIIKIWRSPTTRTKILQYRNHCWRKKLTAHRLMRDSESRTKHDRVMNLCIQWI